jgi:N-acetyl-beta-hexosaminidase
MNDADQVSLNTLKAVTLEMAELFNTDLFHIGADETAGNDKVTGCGLEVSERSERALMKTRSMNPRNDHILN